MTNDLPRRLKQHRSKLVSWTKSRLPVEVVHQEAFATSPEARVREKYLKSGWGKRWLRNALSDASNPQ